MVEPILHFIIPIIILLAFKPNIDKKLVFGLSVLTVMQDFDFIVGHRSLFHNIFFVVLFSVVIYLLFRLVINKNNPKKETENKNAFYLSVYYLFFHLLLDIGVPGVPFFYPFFDKLFAINFNLIVRSFDIDGAYLVDTQTNVFTQSLIEATKSQDVWLATTFGTVLLTVFFIFVLITVFNRKE